VKVAWSLRLSAGSMPYGQSFESTYNIPDRRGSPARQYVQNEWIIVRKYQGILHVVLTIG
jgi:hypothetical protein